MRINPKLSQIINGKEPLECQTLRDDRKVNVYYMDDFDGVIGEFVNKKSQFAVWSSEDGFNYNLFIEKGYYEKVNKLYTAEVNQIWIDFWDVTDKVSKKFTRCFIYPIMGVAVLLCVLSFVLERYVSGVGSIPTYITLGALVLMFIAMIICNSKTKKAILNANVEARNKIIEITGEKEFDALVDAQKTYMDDYYNRLYGDTATDAEGEEKNTEAPNAETPAEEAKEEASAENAEEATTAAEPENDAAKEETVAAVTADAEEEKKDAEESADTTTKEE